MVGKTSSCYYFPFPFFNKILQLAADYLTDVEDRQKVWLEYLRYHVGMGRAMELELVLLVDQCLSRVKPAFSYHCWVDLKVFVPEIEKYISVFKVMVRGGLLYLPPVH